jgi:hypothetical protein
MIHIKQQIKTPEIFSEYKFNKTLYDKDGILAFNRSLSDKIDIIIYYQYDDMARYGQVGGFKYCMQLIAKNGKGSWLYNPFKKEYVHRKIVSFDEEYFFELFMHFAANHCESFLEEIEKYKHYYKEKPNCSDV